MADDFQTKVSDGVLYVFVNHPRLDASAAAALRTKLGFSLDPSVKRAVVSMGAVKFIDSIGVGVLLSIYRKFPKDGAEVALRDVQAGVQAVLELLRLHRVFKVENDPPSQNPSP